MDFTDITIVNVDGRAHEPRGALMAIEHSMRQLPGAKGLLLSPRRPDLLPDGMTHLPIAELGYFEYGLFMIFALHPFIKTPYALVVQDDGWVLDGRNWKAEYFEYDYIGAPVHLARVTRQAKREYVRDFGWAPHLEDPGARVEYVLNGGFSLRSQRFLRGPCELGLPYLVPPMDQIAGPPYRMYWQSNAQLEDVQLCLFMRDALEASGLRFAPLEIARSFSVEDMSPKLHRDFNFRSLLGHHGRMRKLAAQAPPTVEYQVAKEQADCVFGECVITELLRRLGYTIRYKQP